MHTFLIKTSLVIIYYYLFLFTFLYSASVFADIAPSNSPLNADKRLATKLYYSGQGDKNCKINQLSLKTGEARTLYTPKDCPASFIVAGHNHIILIFNNYIQEITLQPQLTEGPAISFPSPKVKAGNSDAVLSDAGYIDGNLSIVMTSIYPWDDEDAFLYQYKSGKWQMLQEKKCRRFEWCGYKELHQRPENAYFWNEELNPWHRKQQNNPYVTGRKTTSNHEYDNLVNNFELTFQFINSKSILSISTQAGQDTDTTLTMGIKMKTRDAGEKILSQNQCSSSLMGKYLIVYALWGDKSHQLYDLETGILLKKMTNYSWVYE